MKFLTSKSYSGDQAWDATDIAEIEGATVRLHWTDKPYIWHINDGDEVFVVMDGQVEMRYRAKGEGKSRIMDAGDIFHAESGDEHVAHPIGEARILVIEKKGSL